MSEDEEAVRVPAKFVYGILVILGGGLSAAGLNLFNDPRPDPWTGTQAKQAHATIERDIARLERELAAHIATCQQNYRTIDIRMEEMIDRLSRVETILERMEKSNGLAR